MVTAESSACVVGGGLAGLATAALLNAQGHAVTLVESSTELGGLLRGRVQPGLGTFDCGRHLIDSTGSDTLDALLFRSVEASSDWNRFPEIPNAAYFAGHLSDSGFIDSNALGADLHDKGLEQLLALPPDAGDGSLRIALEERFGKTFTDHIYAPVVKKLLGLPLEELSASAISFFGLGRLVCGTPAEAISLKGGDPWHDARLAFHRPRAGVRSFEYYYPRHGGTGRWIALLVDELKESGVRFLTGDSVVGATLEGDRVRSLELGSGKSLDTGLVAWTVSPVHLLRATGRALPGGLARPRFTGTLLVDLIVDRAPATDALYVSCYDPTMETFRVTLYDNLERSGHEPPHRLTVEVIRHPGTNEPEPSDAALFDELRRMGIFPAGTRVMASARDHLPDSYPLLTDEFLSSRDALLDAARGIASNVHLLGRAAGSGFFKHDVYRHIVDTFRVDTDVAA